MRKLIEIPLKTELDLIAIQKCSSKTGELLDLPFHTRSAFSTAVLEISRNIVEQRRPASLLIGISKEKEKAYLKAIFAYSKTTLIRLQEDRLELARKLVDNFFISSNNGECHVHVEIAIDPALITHHKFSSLCDYFDKEKMMFDGKGKDLLNSEYINEKKSEFFSVASHELKTPLTSLKAYVQLAMNNCDGCDDAIKEYLFKINKQSLKIEMLIRQLLDISWIESEELNFRMEKIKINDFIEEVVCKHKHLLSGHEVSLQLSKNVTLQMDRLRMEEVLFNILNNATKYSEKNTLIELKTHTFPAYMIISITDKGIGISKEHMHRIFDKFYRATETVQQYSGLGLGLYIASRIINGHKGKIWVDSEKGKGASFHFSLPVLN